MIEKTQKIIKELLDSLGEDTTRNGLIETPSRVAKMYKQVLSGYEKDPKDLFKVFDIDDFDGTVIVGDIRFYSLCEHHMIPFFGKVYIGYVPNNKILGLSKFARLVELFSQRLQVQEKLTSQIADSIMEYLKPKGVIVVSHAEHLCMSMRGVKKPGSITKVIVKRGLFNSDNNLVQEFLSQI